MLLLDKLYVDGNLSKPINFEGNDYKVWRAVDIEGNTLVSFYGPMSLSACATFVKNYNEGNNVGVIDAIELMIDKDK